MAYQAIGRGTSANDGTGDDLRTGAGKVNDNFVEVYTKLGDGSTLYGLTFPNATDTVVTLAETQTLTNKTLTAPTITGAGAIAGVFTGNLTGNADTATALATARTVGGVSFDGTANISLPGVDTAGTQNTSGNAATATALATARTIAGVSFDGTANITIAATDLSDTDQALATTGAVQFTGITSRGDGASAVGSIVLNCEVNTHGQTIKSQPHSAAVTNELTLPDGANSVLVSEVATQTLTNKTLDGATLNDTYGSQQSLSGPGAVDVTNLITEVTTTGTGDALTLADGTAGQMKMITYVAEGAGSDTAVLTPTTLNGGTTITFSNLGEGVTLVFGTGGWTAVGINGAVIA